MDKGAHVTISEHWFKLVQYNMFKYEDFLAKSIKLVEVYI